MATTNSYLATRIVLFIVLVGGARKINGLIHYRARVPPAPDQHDKTGQYLCRGGPAKTQRKTEVRENGIKYSGEVSSTLWFPV